MSTPHLEPPELDVPQVLARDWINRHGTFRTVSTGGQRERTGTDWGMVVTEAARWGQRQGWDARGATTGLAERQAPPPLRCPSPATIAECGGPCEEDFRLCDCGLLQQLNPAPATEDSSAPAPIGSLVDDVAKCITPFGEPIRRGWACGAITSAADWLEKRGNVGSAEDLRREAAAWLEAEPET
jgi:hypothetical protein